MKTSKATLMLGLAFASVVGIRAQVGGASGGAPTSLPPATPYAAIAQDGNSTTWERTTYELSRSGQVVPQQHRYQELATGLNYRDPQTGQWQASSTAISVLADGSAAATNMQHQVYFPPNIYNGFIKLVTPDGKSLESQPISLGYEDGSNTVLFAVLTNAAGEILPSGHDVIYSDAFPGLADLLYHNTKAGVEQDVVLHAQPPDPAALGLNPQTTLLMVLTEFINPPPPTVTVTTLPTVAGGLEDDDLTFGAMQTVRGKAFLLMANSTPTVNRVGVAKRWLAIDGRTFLVEEVPLGAIASQLATLPPMAMNAGPARASGMAARHLVPPQRWLARGSVQRVVLAHVTPPRGFVLDYQLVNNSVTNSTFQGDMTYYISDAVDLFKTNAFEGGSVLKYAVGAGLYDWDSQAIKWLGTEYLPVVMTAVDDNSIGETISGSTGTPSGYYANPALNLEEIAPTITGFRIAYAQQAIYVENNSPEFYDGQIVNCQNGLCAQSCWSGNVPLRNVLFSGVQTDFNGMIYASVDVQNSTFNTSGYLTTAIDGKYETMVAMFTNCIVANVTNLQSYFSESNYSTYEVIGGNNGFYNCSEFGANPVTNTFYPFQTVGGGNYYLASGCAFRNAGTNSIDPVLLAQLQTRTTWPPVVYSNTVISPNLTLNPQASRDANAAPDLGYHYDSLDYVFGGCALFSNLTFTAGTAVGWFDNSDPNGVPDSITLNNGANLSFNGNATAPCMFARYTMVQESQCSLWTMSGFVSGAITFDGSGSGMPQLSANFTKWTSDFVANPLRDYWAYGVGYLKNCELYNGQISMYNMQGLYCTNCLFFRTLLAFWDQDYAISSTFENCTFYNGFLSLNRFTYDAGLSSSFWLIENCAYDGTGFVWADNFNGSTNHTLFDYNAYNTNNLSWTNYPFPYPPNYGTNEVVGPHDLMVGGYNWQTNWFGGFYQSTNSPLIKQGSTTADQVGLYHFTTQTNQTIEGTNIVDIGYHYVAVTNGVPFDSNGDGIPDYLEDANGNGLDQSGEIGWNITGDLGLQVIITQPRNNSSLP